MFKALASSLRALFRRPAFESDLEAELNAHAELRAGDLESRGMNAAEAKRQARLELGWRESYKEECRRSYGLRHWDELRQDLRYALRGLRRSPGFSAVAIGSLALGIGANTAVFGAIDALVLRPLPVRAPERLAYIDPTTHSYPAYRDLASRNTTFEAMFAYRADPMALGSGPVTARVWGYLATANYFDALGVRPLAGRLFHAGDDAHPGADPVAVLGFDSWRNRFLSDPNIVGRAINLNGHPYTVIGVAPSGFRGTETVYWPEVWVPMSMQPAIEQNDWLTNRNTKDCMVAGRLKAGVTRARAEANLRVVAAELAREYPRTDAAEIRLSKLGLMGASLRDPLEAFLSGVILLSALTLLAACANLASLMAARASDRGHEMAIRVSMGAGRGRIARQLMTEAATLALAGGVGGCALASALLAALRGASLAEVPVRIEARADARVLLFGLATAAVSAALFGISPLRQAFRGGPNASLRGAAERAGGRVWPLRETLLAAQVALCCVLVTASFVAAAGARRAFEMPLGIQPRGAIVVGFDLGLANYAPKDGAAFQKRALDAVLRIPGVTAAAAGDSFPLGVDQSTYGVFRYGETDFRAARAIGTSPFNVSPGYFEALGTRLLAGRDFTWHDGAQAPPVAVVNRQFARQVLGSENGVGRYFRTRPKSVVQVVGIVEDGKYRSIGEDPRPAMFLPLAQSYNGATYLVARSAEAEIPIARQMEAAIHALDPNLPLYSVGPLRNLLDLAFFRARAAAWLLGAFGVLALMLAITGIHGLSAYTVSRRTREIGIRVAIGARPRQVLRSVLGRMAVILAVGTAAGLAGGAACSRLLASLVDQAAPGDPRLVAAVAATMVAAALLSCLAPARRAISVDPVRSLRTQ